MKDVLFKKKNGGGGALFYVHRAFCVDDVTQ